MYFPDDIWLIMTSFMFHNIKTQGKHLLNDPYIKLYNYIIKLMPPLIIPRIGPRIVYSSATKTIRFVKFIYLRPLKYDLNKKKYIHNYVIREYQLLSDNYLEHEYYEQYYNQAYSI